MAALALCQAHRLAADRLYRARALSARIGFIKAHADMTGATAMSDSSDQVIHHRRPYLRSRLLRHRAELVARRREGYSLAQLQSWLRRERQVSVPRSTISRRLRAWPESPDAEAHHA